MACWAPLNPGQKPCFRTSGGEIKDASLNALFTKWESVQFSLVRVQFTDPEMLHSNRSDAGREGPQSRLLPSSAQGCPVPLPGVAPGPLLVVCREEVCRWKTFPLSSLGAGLQVGNSGSVCKVGGKRGSRQLGSSLWFLDLLETRFWN